MPDTGWLSPDERDLLRQRACTAPLEASLSGAAASMLAALHAGHGPACVQKLAGTAAARTRHPTYSEHGTGHSISDAAA